MTLVEEVISNLAKALQCVTMTVTDATVASIASSSSMSLIDPAVVAKKLPKKDSKPGKITLKKTIFKKTDVKDGDIGTSTCLSKSSKCLRSQSTEDEMVIK